MSHYTRMDFGVSSPVDISRAMLSTRFPFSRRRVRRQQSSFMHVLSAWKRGRDERPQAIAVETKALSDNR